MKVVCKNIIVITYNIDKGGDDITISIRLLNRKAGNSIKHNYPITSAGGPVSECYGNEKQTFFNQDYPTGETLQGFVDDSYFVLNVITSNRQCRSMFQPIPKHGVCENRSISVDLIPDMVDKSDGVVFKDDIVVNGGPPEVCIPLDQDRISVHLINAKDNELSCVGVQFVLHSKVVLTQKFRAPLDLTGQMSNMALQIQQVIGIPKNDEKQQLILASIPGCGCTHACPDCTS